MGVLGILGAIVGGWIFSMLGLGAGGGLVGGIIVAFVGAVVLVWITQLDTYLMDRQRGPSLFDSPRLFAWLFRRLLLLFVFIFFLVALSSLHRWRKYRYVWMYVLSQVP